MINKSPKLKEVIPLC